MTNATVAPFVRFPCFTSFTVPTVTAGGMTLGAQTSLQAYMPHPDGMGDVTWQGNGFGLSAPAGANVTSVTVQVEHRVSNPSAYDQVTAQLIAGGSPVGPAATLTISATYVTDSFTVTAGMAAASLASLAVQVTHHQVAMGMAYIRSAWAQAAYSFANSVGTVAVAGTASAVTPQVQVAYPPVALVAAGTAVSTLHPGFGQATTAGNLLIGWVVSNSSSSSNDITCSNPSWTLLQVAGSAFGWRTLWYKPNCSASETAPSFTSAGSTVMSQLMEFSGARNLDQVAGGVGSGSSSVTVTAPGPDQRSGNLVVAIATWIGSNHGPSTLTLSGTDSSGASLPLRTLDNSSTTGLIFYKAGWAQASAPFGPGADTISSSSSVFDFAGGFVASFQALAPGPAAAALPATPPRHPVAAGGRSGGGPGHVIRV